MFINRHEGEVVSRGGEALLRPAVSAGEAQRRVPALRPTKNACDSPHLLLLGAGASRAACPTGDSNGNIVPLLCDLVSATGIAADLDAAGIEHRDMNFELVYQTLLSEERRRPLARRVEGKIRTYFSRLQLPAHVTLYDRILLSLRPKDAIATFNWDPFLVQAYLRNRHLRELPRILFLHGNVAVGACLDHQRKGFIGDACDACRTDLTPTQLLYPIGTKNYDQDPFIASEWTELRTYLETAYMLTIIGYSAPASDVEAKKIMILAWKSNRTRDLAEIEIVDIKPEAQVEATWSPFFVRNHYGVGTTPSWLFAHARRSCDHFAMATLQQRPCRETPLPETTDLARLQDWAIARIQEELALRDQGRPLPC